MNLKTDPKQFLKFINRLPQVDVAFIPLVENGKEPAVTIKIKENLDNIKLTQDEALRRIQRGQNVGVYAFPNGLCFIDIDDPRAVDLNEFPETFTVKTRSGGYHLYCRFRTRRRGRTSEAKSFKLWYQT